MSLIVFSLPCAGTRSQFIEKRRTMIAGGSPTQKMCMTMPMAIILKENGNFIAPESGTTTRFMEVDSDAIQDTRSRRVLKKEGNPTARRKVDSCCAKCDEKLTEKPKQSGCDPALEEPRTQQARGDPLQ